MLKFRIPETKFEPMENSVFLDVISMNTNEYVQFNCNNWEKTLFQLLFVNLFWIFFFFKLFQMPNLACRKYCKLDQNKDWRKMNFSLLFIGCISTIPWVTEQFHVKSSEITSDHISDLEFSASRTFDQRKIIGPCSFCHSVALKPPPSILCAAFWAKVRRKKKSGSICFLAKCLRCWKIEIPANLNWFDLPSFDRFPFSIYYVGLCVYVYFVLLFLLRIEKLLSLTIYPFIKK